MTIEKIGLKVVSRFDSKFLMGSRSWESMSSEGDELRRGSSSGSADDDDDDRYENANPGAGSDDFDLSELGESGSEFCQVGDQTCCIPSELCDLSDLQGVLSLEVWNECLTEEERFDLTRYLPDMDQDTFVHTLKELFEGANFHFSSPLAKFFEMLKGGLYDPRVALYRQGINFFQRCQHYHFMQKYQDRMVTDLLQTGDVWQRCKGYGIHEKLRVLNSVRSQKVEVDEKMRDTETDYSDMEGSLENLRGKGLKGRNLVQKAKGLKGRNLVQKASRDCGYWDGASSDILYQEELVGSESLKIGKQNRKGLPKPVESKSCSQKRLRADLDSRDYSVRRMISVPYGSAPVLKKHGLTAASDLRAQAREDDMEEAVALQRDRDALHSNASGSNGCSRLVKKHNNFKADIYPGDCYTGIPASSEFDSPRCDGSMNVNQLSDIRVLTTRPSNIRTSSYESIIGAKYRNLAFENDVRSSKWHASQVSMKRNRAEFSDKLDPYWVKETLDEAHYGHKLFQKNDMLDARSRKLKFREVLHDVKVKPLRNSLQQVDGRSPHWEKRSKTLEKGRGKILLHEVQRGRKFSGNEETESDSSNPSDKEEDRNWLTMSELNFQSAVQENSRSFSSRSVYDQKKVKSVREAMHNRDQPVIGMPPTSIILDDFVGHAQVTGMQKHSSKRRQKAQRQHADHFQNTSWISEGNCFSGLSTPSIEIDWQPDFKVKRNGELQRERDASLPLSSLRSSPEEWRQREVIGYDISSHNMTDLQDRLVEGEPTLSKARHFGSNAKSAHTTMKDHHGRFDSTLIGCNSAIKKQNQKESDADTDRKEEFDFVQSPRQQLDELTSLKKRPKKKPEADFGSLDIESSDQSFKVTVLGLIADPVLQIKPQKKPYIPITPTVHTVFSFSVVHLLSAVRIALITRNPEDSVKGGKHLSKTDDEGEKVVQNLNEKQVGVVVPSLTLQGIIDRVSSNPRDPCILETKEPLQELIRGVLKIFSSKSAPLGAKSWKPLAQFEKPTKCWSWVGPVAHSSPDHEIFEVATSPEAWGVSHKLLQKLVDAFASWFKNVQETLRQLGDLPAPPMEMMQVNLDEKERFKDLRSQKSLVTISPSSEEVRAYFRKEEQLRYLVPDRAFSYTAADGKKSIVAPLRTGGGKSSVKARDHFMLKPERPPHVTILCLVRDAAARLPGSIGTRADVSTLIRDSQYIVEEISDDKVNNIVSGALDRLHYERDPCVQYDGGRKLWVYLHRERDDEDFEDDGTSSTKKWKRPKKDANKQDEGTTTLAYDGNAEQTGFDLSADLNLEPPCTVDDEPVDIVHDDTTQHIGDAAKTMDFAEQGAYYPQSDPMEWGTLGFNSVQESELFYQENSTTEDLMMTLLV